MLNFDQTRLTKALEQASQSLIAERNDTGSWDGELSSSALSTAVAVVALTIVQREQPGARDEDTEALIYGGLRWLARNVNGDGGWGDTTRSLSNLSTTALCWAAFGAVPEAGAHFREVVDGAERWIKQRAGRLEPHILVPAIMNRYGRDRTFSVPILMTCAIGDRLGHGAEAWRRVPALPFELAAFPRQWFAALKLPVVSYALPALIAIGQARHVHYPPASRILRFLRDSTRHATLEVLKEIQPSNGGFLEAVPLTSFVVMALASSGLVNHQVTTRGVQFLLESARGDESWPIDTNLTTWLSTLAVNALDGTGLTPEDCVPLRWWLLRQQQGGVHPYTMAAPGGWAWTDLPGGVPDADDTAGALLALPRLGSVTPEVFDAAVAGVEWLIGLQNRDGGIPTFCRGWGTLPFDRSSADITAHALRAWLTWQHELPADLQSRVNDAMARAVRFLMNVQHADGYWTPLWFGNQFAPNEENPVYGTSRVLCALPGLAVRAFTELAESINSGALWLAKAQNTDGSWGGVPGAPPSVEETALAVEALAELLTHSQILLPTAKEAVTNACTWGTHWLVSRIEAGDWKNPAPIGFYFAKLWYHEKLYPQIFTVGALRRVAKLTAKSGR